MLKSKRIFLVFALTMFMATMLIGGAVRGADGDWALIWADEFNGPAGSGIDRNNWQVEVTANPANAELQAYVDSINNIYLMQDPDNPNNRVLVLKAMRDTSGGREYTSGRVNTQNKHLWTYGKFEARLKLPYGQGIWPAFWMLGGNFPTVGWPNCGEIDIMEFVGKEPNLVYGTLHGPAYNGGGGLGAWHRYSGGFTNDWHTYAVEWEPNIVRWYFDGQLFALRTIDDLNGREWVFNHNFFIILNLAVGGEWPGSPNASTVFPQYYYIDYVRVYQRAGGVYPPYPYRNLVAIKSVGSGQYACSDSYATPTNALIANRGSASTWEMFELKDLGGGNTGIICVQNYKYVSVTGNSQLVGQAETAGPNETFQVINNSDGTKSFRNTGNGRYVTVDGNRNMFATATSIGNAEKFTFENKNTSGGATPTPGGATATPTPTRAATPTPTAPPAAKVIPGQIQAENYDAMFGIDTEATGDTGGGLNVGWIDANDWMDYNVNVQTAGTYRIDYRVASTSTTGRVDFRIGGTTLASTAIPNTGGWQTWTTVSANVGLNAGNQTIRLFASGGGWNINWFSATAVGATPTPTRAATATPTPTRAATATPTPSGTLPSATWYLFNQAVSGVVPAGENLQTAFSGSTGWQPLKTITTTASYWYSTTINGTYKAGNWSFILWTNNPGTAVNVTVEIYKVNADGSGAALLGSQTVNAGTFGGGNHPTTFTFSNLPAVSLNNQRLLIRIVKASGVDLTMAYNTNDFPTRLITP